MICGCERLLCNSRQTELQVAADEPHNVLNYTGMMIIASAGDKIG